MKTAILQKLRETGDFVSGQELCDAFGVSRTAVWKAINHLKEEGYDIESVSRRGYRLKENADVLSRYEILQSLDTKWLGQNCHYYDEIDSTNTQLKRLFQDDPDLPHGTLAVTDRQVAGRGRRGRVWETPAGTNIAMSILLRPAFAPDKASMLTILTALAVAEGTEKLTGLPCQIKWPNDVIIRKKKYCGILTEMSAEVDYIEYVIVGIGINVNTTEFPEEIAKTATSIFLEKDEKAVRASLIREILCAFEKYYELFEKSQDLTPLTEIYNKRLVSMNQTVRVLDPKGEFEGISKGINETGELIVEKEGGEEVLVYAGEVSVRGVYGYV